MNRKKVKFNRDQINDGQCLPVQLNGLKACETCPHKDVKVGQEACSSPEIRKSGKNAFGVAVPIQKKDTSH